MHSNADAFRHWIFVHGTLMRGENDYIYWLANPAEALFISPAKTSRRYPLFVNLLPDFPDCSPCMLNLPEATSSCQHIEGELFLITEKMLAWLNVLEGVSEGVHESAPIHVIPQASMSKLPIEYQRLFKPFDVNQASEDSQLTGPLLSATGYFRSKNFPADWQSVQPKSSTTLLSRFSAGLIIDTYRSRFSGVPAHLTSGEFAQKLQLALNALPKGLQPPSTAVGETAYGAPLFSAPIVLFIIDGIGDNTYNELGNRTPLEVVSGMPPRVVSQKPTPGVPAGAMPRILGIEDASLAEKDNKFVLPGINCVTRSGASGLMDPYMAGMSCGSDTAHLSMFGYPPHTYYRGRGGYEALGAGLHLDDEDIAFKCNFATFADPSEEGFGDEDAALERAVASQSTHGAHYVTHRRCDRDFTREGPILCAALHGTTVTADLEGKPFDYPHEIRFQYAGGHRCVVALSGARRVLRPGEVEPRTLGRLSDHITGTDCLVDGRLLWRCAPTVAPSHPDYAAAAYTSRLVEAASARLIARLLAHPINVARRAHNRRVAAGTAPGPRRNLANLVLLRGAAKKGWAPAFTLRHGLHGVLVARTCVIRGVGRSCGLHSTICDGCYGAAVGPGGAPVRDPLDGATGDAQSDLRVKLEAVLHALRVRCPAFHHDPPTASAVPHPHYNFAVLHVKGVDDAGHDRDVATKLELLRRCGVVMQELWDALPAGATMAVVADHSTPVGLGDHCCEPVPVSVATKPLLVHHGHCPNGLHGEEDGKGRNGEWFAFQDGVQYYSENLVSEKGGLGRFRGEALLPLLKRANAYYHYYP